ncbi:type II toxin-antitoxin system ParD family antitoxin [Pseudomonas sp. ODNR1LW]|nr:type II toxin-antitoxin system ParD family antitoxin [Pseudomonas sp. ODNR1LW]
MATLAIELDARLEAFVDRKVGSGAFRDHSEVIQQALADMAQNDAQLDILKAKIQEGLDELEAGHGIEVYDIERWLDGLGR